MRAFTPEQEARIREIAPAEHARAAADLRAAQSRLEHWSQFLVPAPPGAAWQTTTPGRYRLCSNLPNPSSLPQEKG